MNIYNRVALVTGGAHRLGSAFVLALAEAGANVVINFNRSEKEADELVMDIESKYPVKAWAYKADITSHNQVLEMAKTVEREFGRIDIIVNNAGYFSTTSDSYNKVSEWQRVTRTSIDGSFHVVDAFTPLMLKTDGGVIVNLLDGSIRSPWPNFMAHAVGKSGMAAMTRQWALELAPKIRSNGLCLGPILELDDMKESTFASMANATLLREWGNPKDAIKGLFYLIEADYVTGEILTVDGGEQYGRFNI